MADQFTQNMDSLADIPAPDPQFLSENNLVNTASLPIDSVEQINIVYQSESIVLTAIAINKGKNRTL